MSERGVGASQWFSETSGPLVPDDGRDGAATRIVWRPYAGRLPELLRRLLSQRATTQRRRSDDVLARQSRLSLSLPPIHPPPRQPRPCYNSHAPLPILARTQILLDLVNSPRRSAPHHASPRSPRLAAPLPLPSPRLRLLCALRLHIASPRLAFDSAASASQPANPSLAIHAAAHAQGFA